MLVSELYEGMLVKVLTKADLIQKYGNCEDYIDDDNFPSCFAYGMYTTYGGMIVTIRNISQYTSNNAFIRLNEDGGRYTWNPAMFKRATTPKGNTIKGDF